MKGTLKCGFEYEIDEKTLDDYRLLDLISQIEKNPLQISLLITKLLGEDQKEALLTYLESQNGTATIQAVTDCVVEIFKTPQIKNLSSSPK